MEVEICFRVKNENNLMSTTKAYMIYLEEVLETHDARFATWLRLKKSQPLRRTE